MGNEDHNSKPKPPHEVINTIIGATEAWVTSKQERNQHLRYINVLSKGTLQMEQSPWHVTFSEDDLEVL